ncbi:hypothetical protein H2O64_18110 [Kordia sp. YSTF-M3]|uniref:Bacteriocin n=1 Tax=Kordia aestuariivivens TaxID=2759037 RepID=A0ABR7QDH2_9FLAO|nr:hypothetical protein [Kordia aestuariivivens]MBC8756592.1 hypothetical protein [Kordia aestuariivivens]
MKKQKLGLNKLSLTKSRIAELNTLNAKGAGRESTNPQCILTGVVDGCDITENCNTNDCGSNNCTDGCNPTATRAILSCLFPC